MNREIDSTHRIHSTKIFSPKPILSAHFNCVYFYSHLFPLHQYICIQFAIIIRLKIIISVEIIAGDKQDIGIKDLKKKTKHKQYFRLSKKVVEIE